MSTGLLGPVRSGEVPISNDPERKRSMTTKTRQPEPRTSTIEDITRREFLIGAGSILILAPYGCGGRSAGGGNTPGEIRVEHAAGVTEVPRDVDRIAAIDGWPDLHSLLALGIVPEIASTEYQKDSPVIQDRIDEVEQSVERGAPELEALAGENPGIIFGVEDSGQIYDELSEIAPTILLDRYESSVNDHLRTIARALGRPAAARRVTLDYEDRSREVADSVQGSELFTTPIAIVTNHPSSEGTFNLLGPDSYAGRTLGAVGVGGLIGAEGKQEGPNGEFGTYASTELMAEILGPAELILFATNPLFEDTTPWTKGALWNVLPAVREDAVVESYADTWYFDTALTRMARLEDIERLVRRFG